MIKKWKTGGKSCGKFLMNITINFLTCLKKLNLIKPGGYIAPHKHPWEQEIIVTRGRLQIMGSNGGKIIGKNDVAYFSENEEHGVKVIGDEPSEFYCIIGCLGKGENCLGISEE